jgi:hypothetical protein
MASIVVAGDTSGTVTLAAPAVSGTTTLTLPTTTGNVVADTATQTLTNKTLGAGTVMPTGSVLQVVSTTKTDTFSTASTSATDITGLSVSITPSSASNKILIMFNVNTSMENFQMSTFLVRNSTTIFVGDTAGSRVSATTALCGTPGTNEFTISNVPNVGIYLDSPSSTSSVTYKIQTQVNAGTGYVNRSYADDNANYRGRTPSSITVMEIKG